MGANKQIAYLKIERVRDDNTRYFCPTYSHDDNNEIEVTYRISDSDVAWLNKLGEVI